MGGKDGGYSDGRQGARYGPTVERLNNMPRDVDN